jgi:multimeric flavodoxin WrbA
MVKDKNFKIAAIYGSPRLDGNTSILTDRFLEGVKDGMAGSGIDLKIEKIAASKMDISPCRECGSCSRTGECIVQDDMQGIFKTLIEADFIAAASPVFFTTVSAYLKALIDRCQRFWVLKSERQETIINKERKGIFIGASGSGSGTIFDCPKKVIRAFFDVLYVEYDRDFLHRRTDSKGDILKNRQALEEIYKYGKEIGTSSPETAYNVKGDKK